MKFQSIEEIKKYFKYSNEDINDLRLKIIKERNSYHPDKSGGDFSDENQKNKYFICQEAIDYLESYKLEYVDQKSDILKIIEQNQALIEQQNKSIIMEKNLKTYKDSMNTSANGILRKYKSRYMMPKMTSTGVLAFMTFIQAFPKTFHDNILSKNLITDNIKLSIQILWIYILIFTAMLWCICWLKENRLKIIIDDLSMESIQNQLFNNYITKKMDKNNFYHCSDIYRDNDNIRVNKVEFVNYTKNLGIEDRRMRVYYRYLDDVLYKVADIVFEKAENKGIIRKIEQKTLNDEYEIIG
ncbi:hypothetical protein [Clostridium baratii]|uniref:hypothetical protein n=1 Tax=Clostridium baratii TaxID=1561 RepID=UPI00097FBD37|nr:hypothetical protein [Clostridium baratii]AQM60835.1 hypothetical protein NPD11_432 [Clostridium baratii]